MCARYGAPVVQKAPRLDASFAALANPTRRAVVERLMGGERSVSELAEPFGMALPSVMQHLRVLEEAGLITTRKRGRVRTVRVETARLTEMSGWLDRQRAVWEARLDRLDAHVLAMKEQEQKGRPRPGEEA